MIRLRIIIHKYSRVIQTWIAFSVVDSGILQGNAKDDDLGLVETHPGFVEGQGLIFL